MLRDNAYLLDILAAARRTLAYIGDMTKDEWLKDDKSQDAVIRRLEIIGEAARRVSAETKELLDLPWQDIIGMRNTMIHEYDEVDLELVWDTVTRDIPPLISVLEELVPTQEEE